MNTQQEVILTSNSGQTMSGGETTCLKCGSISTVQAVVMSVSAAAPAMCLSGSMSLFMMGAGRAVPLAFFISTIVIAMVSISIGKLATKYSAAGGTYSYVRSAISGQAGWWTGWLYIGITIAAGVIGTIFAMHLNILLPGVPMWACVIIIAIPTFFVGWFGIDLSAKLVAVLWVLQTILILIPAFYLFGLELPNFPSVSAQFANGWLPEFGVNGLIAAVCVTVWSYIGFEVPAYLGEEIVGGAKAVRKAVTFGAICIGITYIVVSWIWILPVSSESMDVMINSAVPLVGLTNFLNYPAGQWFIICSVLISCLCCWLSFISAMQRMIYDMGRCKALPSAFAKLNKRQSPSVALYAIMIVWVIVSLLGCYWNVNIWLTMLAMIASMAYIMVCIAAIKDNWSVTGGISLLTNKIFPFIIIAIMCWMIFSQKLFDIILCLGFGLIGLIIVLIIQGIKGKKYFTDMQI